MKNLKYEESNCCSKIVSANPRNLFKKLLILFKKGAKVKKKKKKVFTTERHFRSLLELMVADFVWC